MNTDELKNYRNKIDVIDRRIITLLSERFKVVKEIGDYKKNKKIQPLDKKRWKNVISNRITLAKRLKLDTAFISELYDLIHKQSLNLQGEKSGNTFGIQGGIGSFNEQALQKYFKEKNIQKHKVQYLYTTKKVLKNLNEGAINFGLFAITNSTGGIVEESIKALAKYPVTIIYDFEIPIQHFLMKRKDVDTKEIKGIMAHPQVFAQCKDTLNSKFKKYKLISGKGDLVDTAKAAEYLASGKLPKTTAILGPIILSKMYNLEIIAENLQDKKDNLTRFLLVKRR